MTMSTVKVASAKSCKFLGNLIDDRDNEQFLATLPNDEIGEAYRNLFIRVRASFAALAADDYEYESLNAWLEYEEYTPLAQSDCSKFIDGLKNCRRKDGGATKLAGTLATEPGMYKVGDDIFKVQQNRAGTNLYAKLLVVHDRGGEDVEVSFEYAGSLVKNKIVADAKLSYEDAKAFGALYGTCCACGKLLTHELSIALGIGPVCGGRQFGGEFKMLIDAAKLELAGK